MQGLVELRDLTNKFFLLHWRIDSLGEPGQWSDLFPLASSGPYPNSNYQGCYALFSGTELRYVGVGSSRGSGKYIGQGIGSRLKHVVEVDWTKKSADGSRIYKARDKWSAITHISTVGFKATGYLAISLEHYLLSELDSSQLLNSQRPGSAT